MKSSNIFIHVPKTGGTTINCVMANSEWQTEPDFNYRHIVYETKRSNSADIFNPLKNDRYSEYEVFTMLRNPIDRLISEYYFIKDRPEFMSLLKPVPSNLMDYVKHRQTRNYMVGFLLGKRMYDEELVTENDLQLVINTIKNLNIKVGFFEEYEKSMIYFSSITGIKWPKTLNIKRKTLNRPELSEIPENIRNIIIKNNTLDFELYNYFKSSFDNINIASNSTKINFVGNEYDYIMKYTQRFNLLQIGLKNLNFIRRNQLFFNDLNKDLHKKLKMTDGKSYVSIWNDCFIKSFTQAHPNSDLTNKLNSIEPELEPLNKLKLICKILNKYLDIKKVNTKILTYNPSKLNFQLKVKTGFFTTIFSKFK